ncbi:hypothetical protein ACFSTC_15235 [Nonomuraea ferruginea]
MSLSLNQWTTRRWSLPEAVDGCVRHGLEAVGLWREKVAETGLARSAKLVREAGLRVSSLCRGGFLTAGGLPGEEGRAGVRAGAGGQPAGRRRGRRAGRGLPGDGGRRAAGGAAGRAAA